MTSPIRIAGITLRYLSPLIVIVAGVLVSKALIASRKAPPRTPRPPRVLPVDTVLARAAEDDASLRVFGTVEPLGSLEIRPVVGGPVTSVHPNLVLGGRIDEGEVLVTIDPRDFELAVRTARAAVIAAEAELDLERGNAAVAAKEWELLEGSIEVSAASKRLALREPFIARRAADVDTAKAQVELAELNLSRARIVAPFDLLVLSETVEVGATVAQGSVIANVVDRGQFALRVSVPQDRLGALEWTSRPARVHAAGAVRDARLTRLLGEVDAEGRMARIEVAIDDPLGGETPILLGSYVEVELPLIASPEALVIPRTALREGDTVWVVSTEKTLAFQKVTVGLRRDGDVLISAGLEPGDEVITSAIAVPLPGMPVAPITEDKPAAVLTETSAANAGADQ